MAYMLLILEHEDRNSWSDDQAVRAYETMMAFRDDLQAKGTLITSNSLRPSTEAVRIRLRGGKRAVLDGPFSEAKELVGGFFLLNVPTKEHAIAIANECPATEWGTVEVREVSDICLRDDLRHRVTR